MADGSERARLDAVFGEVLPVRTGDERDDPDAPAPGDHDRELLDDRPPHHDRD